MFDRCCSGCVTLHVVCKPCRDSVFTFLLSDSEHLLDNLLGHLLESSLLAEAALVRRLASCIPSGLETFRNQLWASIRGAVSVSFMGSLLMA